MKLLVANKMDWEHPRSGGVEVNLRETLGRLTDRGHEVHLVTSRFPGGKKHEVLDGVHVHRYGFPGRTNEIFILTAGQVFFNYWVAKLDPDVIYTVNSLMTWVPLLHRERNIVSVHHLNGMESFEQFSFPLDIAAYLAEKAAVRLIGDRPVLTVSESTEEDLVKEGVNSEGIEVVQNGVNFDSFEEGENYETPTVLYLGRMEHTKGADLLTGIYENIEESFEGSFRFEIAGKGSMEEKVQEFAEDRENVSFHGHVNEQKKRELLKRSWVALAPSRREGWGLIVSEANASGTPVIGFEKGGLKQSIKDDETGMLVRANPAPAKHVDEFGEAVAELLDDEDRIETYSENARELASKRPWSRTVDRIESIFKRLS